MSTELVTFEIATQNMPRFQREFAALCVRARRLKVEEPTYRIVGERHIEAIVREFPIPTYVAALGRKVKSQVIKPACTLQIVSVSGPAPKLAGWTFAAVLQHEKTGNIIRRVPGSEALNVALDMRTASPYCGHCKAIRQRLDTYVVVHEDGRQMQVGRQCLRDFTGHESPEAIARWAELLAAFKSAEDERDTVPGFGGPGMEYGTDIADFLGHVACMIRVHGEWLSRTKAREFGGGRIATADLAWANCFPTPTMVKDRLVEEVTQADWERAANCLQTAKAFFETQEAAGIVLGDYEFSLRVTIESRTVTARSAGIAGSVISFAERLLGKEMERRKAALPSEFQGAIGKREIFRLSIIRVIDISSELYGTSHLHLMQDAAGNRFTWKTSSACLEQGSTYDVKATVKEHKLYTGRSDSSDPRPAIKQTILVRCVATRVAEETINNQAEAR